MKHVADATINIVEAFPKDYPDPVKCVAVVGLWKHGVRVCVGVGVCACGEREHLDLSKLRQFPVKKLHTPGYCERVCQQTIYNEPLVSVGRRLTKYRKGQVT